MRVAVIGGTGVVGRLVATELVARGNAVRVVSRTATVLVPGPSGVGIEHRAADVRSVAGLPAALKDLEGVMDAVNDSRGTTQTFVATHGPTFAEWLAHSPAGPYGSDVHTRDGGRFVPEGDHAAGK